jgi:hypothetical protein
MGKKIYDALSAIRLSVTLASPLPSFKVLWECPHVQTGKVSLEERVYFRK